MKYKLMAVDVDGTLLDSSGRLAEKTRTAVRKAVQKGLIFTISTGRPMQGVSPLTEQLGLDRDLPLITYNGAMVVLGKSEKIIYQQSLSPEDTRQIIQLGNSFGTTVLMWADNRLYTSSLNEKALKYSEISGVAPVLINDKVLKNGATKVLWFDDADTIEKYEKEAGRFVSGNVNYHTSRPVFLEFVDSRASKAIAMEKLGQYFGIDRSEMISAGDGSNDLSMIEYAGLGVAMANAKETVKEKADYITLSNDEDGIAHIIHRFVLEDI